MKKHKHNPRARRAFLRACVAVPTTFVLAACAGQSAGEATPQPTVPSPLAPTSAPARPTPTALPPTALPPTQPLPTQQPSTMRPTQPPPQAAPAVALQPTPACDDGDDETPAQTEGPYFTPNTPERASLLEPGIAGTRLVVTGYVLTTGCTPVARALLDFWHADDGGAYDNAGYRLRGHQFTDDQGRYTLETILPGLYTGRTRHIHVKVQAPNQAVLTTQLYFPDEQDNSRDGIFRPELVMQVQDAADGKAAAFDFVLDV
jgi:protocatechuate 3,4-dioxygenase beta subunit